VMELVVSSEDWGEMGQPFLLANKSREVIISMAAAQEVDVSSGK
jgi:hypothetical protein